MARNLVQSQWLLGVSGGSRGEWCGVVREAGKCGTRVFRGWREKLCITQYFECRGDRGGFEDPDYPNKVYKVVKALYGLHQAPRAWKFGLTDGKSASTPIDTKKPLLKDPDVYACSRFQVTPKASHLHAVKRICRYLEGKPHLGLWYPKDSPFNLVAYSDSDYAGASLDRKSTTGGCQILGCKLISWQCKKKIVVATSSIEAEYIATASCCAQVIQTSIRLLERMLHVPHILSAGYIITPQMILNSPCLIHIKNLVQIKWSQSWLVQKQTSIGNDESNPFIVDSLLKTICLVRNVDSSSKFYMYLRFLQLKIRAQVGDLSSYTTKYSSHFLTQKVFANMRRVRKGFSRVETPLFEGMLVPQQAAADVDDVVADDDAANDVPTADVEPTPPSPPPTTVGI
nr:hypothetical protein [Tanacetum cinerariifolium]